MIYGMKPFNGAEMRQYLDILGEQAPMQTNPKGVPIKTSQPFDMNKEFKNIGQQMTSLGPDFRKTHQDLTPGSDYYQKNIANNPDLVKKAADVTSRMSPDEFDASVADTNARLDKVTAPGRDLGRSATSPEYDAVADKVGLPSMQPMQETEEKEMNEDLPGTQGTWMHGGFKVRYNPSTQTVTVQGKNQERSHKFSSAPSERSYHQAVQQLIDKLEDESEMYESPSLVMREWMTICR
jgi:hypothetical protein